MPGPASTRVAAVQSWPALKYPAMAMASAALLDIGVVEDHHRRLAAELEMDPLDVLGGGDGDLAPGPHAPGDRHHLGHRVRHQGPARLAVAAHHVEHARAARTPAAISARSSVVTGVVWAGLSTTVLPAAMAGANFHTAIIIG